ncbi:hypothetical protein N7478_000015 [Penicillium angulare]|uniref:uncharacterized protein n=1 Tax=Penicillium angulare TaxID=116970 RepID=UPI0025410E53|nr:uncharacterized protein N7478_000015 [Penicillium angulare]KAJ5290764.1 hypothetical protein N7478_000015 [Penicillium angulare]
MKEDIYLVLPVHNRIVGRGNPEIVKHCLPDIFDEAVGKVGGQVCIDRPAVALKLGSGQRCRDNAATELGLGYGVGPPGCALKGIALSLAAVVGVV